MEIEKKIGERIYQLRKEQNVSQEKLAEKADLDRTYVSSVERGKRNVSVINLEKISSALGCSLQEFFTSDLFTNKKTEK
jgi:transcriptional regulator with XRE-family HTH domain